MTNYKKILKHRLYERYMDNMSEFLDLCQILDEVEAQVQSEERQFYDFIKKLAEDSRFEMTLESGKKIRGGKGIADKIVLRRKKTTIQKGDTVITKILKSGIPKGTKGVIVRMETMYKFISDFSNDYQAWYTAEELEEAKDETL